MEGILVEIVREKGTEGKTMKEMILVQVMRRTHSDYYIVDLGANKATRTPIATLLNEDGNGSTVCSGSVLYNVGGEMSADKLLEGGHTIDSNHHIHEGASCLKLNIPHLSSLLKGGGGQGEDNDNDVSNYKWEAAPPIRNYRFCPRSASLGDDFRLFCGDLGNEVNDDVLSKAFSRFPSFNMAKVVRDKRTGKTKGYGFVSFANITDLAAALKEMNGKYVGNRPIKLRKSNWKERTDNEAVQRQKSYNHKKPKPAKKSVLHK